MTTTSQIINNRQCIVGLAFKLDCCRDCNLEYQKQCPDYIPQNNSRQTQGKVVQAFENEMSRGSNPLPTLYDIIRDYNDRMVI